MSSIPSCATLASHSCLTSNSFTSPSSSTSVNSNLHFPSAQNNRSFCLKPFKFSQTVYASQSGGQFDDKDNINQVRVQKQILKAGSGPKPVAGQNVTVHCTGYGKDGALNQTFWSTKDPGQQPFTFRIGQGNVIRGWDEGVLGMQLGEVARLRCSPD